MATFTRKEIIALYEAGERNFSGFDLSDLNLFNLDLRGSDFSEANLSGASLRASKLMGSNFFALRAYFLPSF